MLQCCLKVPNNVNKEVEEAKVDKRPLDPKIPNERYYLAFPANAEGKNHYKPDYVYVIASTKMRYQGHILKFARSELLVLNEYIGDYILVDS